MPLSPLTMHAVVVWASGVNAIVWMMCPFFNSGGSRNNGFIPFGFTSTTDAGVVWSGSVLPAYQAVSGPIVQHYLAAIGVVFASRCVQGRLPFACSPGALQISTA